MQIAAAAEPGARQTLLLGGRGSFLEVSHKEAVLPVTMKRLPQRRNAGFGGLSASVAVLAAISAVASAYLVLRCAKYMANASKNTEALRFLADAHGKTNKEPREPCSAPEEEPPASAAAAGAAAAAGEEEEEESLVKQELLERVFLHAVELNRLVDISEPVVRQLKPNMGAQCISVFLRLALVELSAMFALLDENERYHVNREVRRLYSQIWTLRNSIGTMGISTSRYRHIKCLHVFLGRLKEVKPVTAALGERQRLLMIKQLLQLQEMALEQLNTGLFWLSVCVKDPTKAHDNARAAAATAHGCAVAAEGSATAADARVVAVVKSMEVTVSRRRAQVLGDPLLSGWLRELHTENIHYGLIVREAILRLTRPNNQSHRERVKALQDTPLAQGDEPWKSTDLNVIKAQESAAASTVGGLLIPGDHASPGGERLASLSPRRSKVSSQDARRGNGTAGATPVSLPPSTSTAAVAAAAEGGQETFRRPSCHMEEPLLGVSSALSQVSAPAAAGRSQIATVSAALRRAGLPYVSTNPLEATWVSMASGVTSVGKSSNSHLSPEEIPRASQGSFRAAASAASAFSPEAFALSTANAGTQRVAPAVSSGAFWPSLVTYGKLPVDPHTWPPVSASSPAGSKSSPGASGPRFGGPLLPHERPHTAPGPSTSSFGAAKAPLSQTRGTYGSALQGAAQFASASSGASASQRLPASTLRSVESHSSSETKPPGIPVDIYGTPLDFRLWGLGEAAPYRPVAGVWPNEEPDEPSQEAIDAGFEQLARLFSGAPEQHPGETMHPR
ncbi:hypothetical protein, conserved [Eimeria acervulina]|uniref:Uncharacterized protein n=1 Tax=Eimeria acervulina TaxID=5801 RepID=U6GH19_EIMAC|nr:hypothetical protein, conserved [Eimeria acervulina]CDI78563.1 hypothetical protein, conserved [Eimeria acervulina]